MLITCPSCNTNFAVNANAIGDSGKKVKCSKCKNIWFQAPASFDKQKLDDLLDAPKVEISKSEDKQLPVRISNPNNRKYVLMSLLLITLIVFLQVVKEPKNFKAYSETINLVDYEGLKFNGLKVVKERIDNKLYFYIDGSIINFTDKNIKLPEVKIEVFSEGGSLMNRSYIQLPKQNLGPYGSVKFNPEITGVSGNAYTINLSFINWLEAIFD